jgi:mRNA-degrading endonuclease RelE of RelBE toxin-antitoxin system
LASRILYKSSVRHDLKKVARIDQGRILRQIREILAANPKSGDPLHGEFEGLFKLRVGDYRVVYALVGEGVLVLRIRHRSKAYG